MHSVNHAVVGMGIALVLPPTIGLPAAFLSHYVLDMLPHYGIPGNEGYKALFRHKTTFVMVAADIVGLAILAILASSQSWYVFVAIILALLPDIMWPYRYFLFERINKKPPKEDPLTHFHIWIQWCERKWGVFLEIPLATILIIGVWKLT
jgi:hypothetical protein